MIREVDLNEISDGRLYELNDMVKADCHECHGCSKCCSSDMGQSILLDPLDVYRLMHGLGRDFDSLIFRELELSLVDGLIQPHMRMSGKSAPVYENGSDEPVVHDIPVGCQFLSEDGRCSIHSIRPGICRLFPLGRVYEGGKFKYFLQKNECISENRSKVKVSKWIDTENLELYERFVRKWHNFKEFAEKKARYAENEENAKIIMLSILSTFYSKPYEAETEEEFYPEFDARLKEIVGIIRKV